MSTLRRLINSITPRAILAALARRKMKKAWPAYTGLSTQDIFRKIYADGAWGQSGDAKDGFYSGSGSHDESIVGAYVASVQAFLNALGKPDVVDLGCGDFSVGARLRPSCNRYIACDIVESLIKRNRVKYRLLNVDFRVLDLAEDQLPAADVLVIRQVLQHLGNQQIAGALSQIPEKYKYLVLTEHLPVQASFVPNLDHPSGPDNRLGIGSGIVLTCPPFNLRVTEERLLCEVPEVGGVIRTMMYKLA